MKDKKYLSKDVKQVLQPKGKSVGLEKVKRRCNCLSIWGIYLALLSRKMCSKEEESSKKISEGQSNPPTVAEQVEIKFVKAELNLLHQKKCELSK